MGLTFLILRERKKKDYKGRVGERKVEEQKKPGPKWKRYLKITSGICNSGLHENNYQHWGDMKKANKGENEKK